MQKIKIDQKPAKKFIESHCEISIEMWFEQKSARKYFNSEISGTTCLIWNKVLEVLGQELEAFEK